MQLYQVWTSIPLDSGLWRHQVLGIFDSEANATRACGDHGSSAVGQRTLVSNAWLDRLEWSSGFVRFLADGREMPDPARGFPRRVKVEFGLLDEALERCVYLLSHSAGDADSRKDLGVFGNPDAVLRAVKTAAVLPGFRLWPEGFVVSELEIGRVYWPDSPVPHITDDEPLGE